MVACTHIREQTSSRGLLLCTNLVHSQVCNRGHHEATEYLVSQWLVVEFGVSESNVAKWREASFSGPKALYGYWHWNEGFPNGLRTLKACEKARNYDQLEFFNLFDRTWGARHVISRLILELFRSYMGCPSRSFVLVGPFSWFLLQWSSFNCSKIASNQIFYTYVGFRE